MTATVDNAVADLQRTIDELRAQLDERTAERDDALRRETATAEVLQVINASPGDLAPVFDAMLDKALRLCNANCGHFRVLDGDVLDLVASRGVPSAYIEFLRTPAKPEPGNPLGRMIRGEPLIVSLDAADEEPYRAGDPLRRAFVDLGGARSAVNVALVKDDRLLGTLTVYRQQVRPFSDKQIALLQNFAAQAVIAMENARLITETREALEQQTATAEVLGVINSSPGDLAPVFDAMLEKATRLCEASFGQLYTYDDEAFHPVAVHGEAHVVKWIKQRGPVTPTGDGTLGGSPRVRESSTSPMRAKTRAIARSRLGAGADRDRRHPHLGYCWPAQR